MICPKCNSENVTVQAVSITKDKKKGLLYWLIVGWWWEPLLWLFLTIPMIFISLFGRKKTTTKVQSMAVCQNCGNKWKV